MISLYRKNIMLKIISVFGSDILLQIITIHKRTCPKNYKYFSSPVPCEQALLSVRITCLIYVVVLLILSKKITGKYIVIGHNHFHTHTLSNYFSWYSRFYID